jgi:opacity protein-like surface antigen
MKKTLILLATVAALALPAIAQTNANSLPDAKLTAEAAQSQSSMNSAFQQICDVLLNSSNAMITVSGGVKLSDNDVKLAAFDYLYGFNQNAYLIVGYDYVWSSRPGESSANIVKGGLQLQAEGKLFGVLTVRPFAASLISTPTSGTSNNGGAALINLVGIEFTVKKWQRGQLHVGGYFENRTAMGFASGNYLCGGLGYSW